MRSVAEFGDLTQAEQGLLDHLRKNASGEFYASKSLPPENAPRDLHIRASLIRALVLGQIAEIPLPERGIGIGGAFIFGDGAAGGETAGLDLEGADLSRDLGLYRCRIPDTVLLRGASIRNLYLNGSALAQMLDADRLEAQGGVFLRGVSAAGEIRLRSAKLRGSLDCIGAKLSAKPIALAVDELETMGGVTLRKLTAEGTVRLTGAKLGTDFDCDGAQFLSTRDALVAERALIHGAWAWRNGARSAGLVNFLGARIGSVCDYPSCWPSEIVLHRCRYGSFDGEDVPADARRRLDWLSRQKPEEYGHDFWPQPYEQCARVLRELGHGADARLILIEKERLQRAARHRRLGRDMSEATGFYRKLGIWLQRWLLRSSDAAVGTLVAYGRRPLQAAIPLIGLLFIGGMIFAFAAGKGQIKPNLPQIQRAPEWVACGRPEGERIAGLPGYADRGRAVPGETQLICFMRQEAARAYPQFSPLIYSADTLLPIVNLEMQSYWIPDDSKPIGAAARLYLWFHIFAGWALTLLAVAGFSGLIKTDNTR